MQNQAVFAAAFSSFFVLFRFGLHTGKPNTDTVIQDSRAEM
jgi:hypothetical protein